MKIRSAAVILAFVLVLDLVWTERATATAAQSSRNPRIAKDTVQSTETPKYVRVQYDITVEFQGQLIRQRHVNYYFAFQQKCVDVHISVIAPTKADEDIFVAFDRSLRYGS